ncbi:MAG: aminotransferase class V-fold PLP-dependent enzyme [Anaerolineae bacterium]
MAYNNWMFDLESEFLLDPTVCFLNHGSFGATPRAVFDVYQAWQRELERQPVEFLGRRHNDLMRASRQALAAYFGTRAENVVYTQNVTIAINIVARSLELGPGDEVLASDHEYGACDRTWRFLASQRGFEYVRQRIALPLASREQVIDELWGGVTPRTRVIFLSHITSPTAIRFPVEEVCQRAKAAGIVTIIDGAHAPGQIPLDLEALDADFYGGNLHKWLCAPKGAGFLYARPEMQRLLKPLVVSWGYEAELPSGSAFIDQNEWWGTRDIAAFLAVPAAIEFQASHNWDAVRIACHQLLGQALDGMARCTGLSPVYPDDSWYVQAATAPLPTATDVTALKARLYDEYRVEVPLIEWNGRKLMRISIQGYNGEHDVERLLEAVAQLL